MGFGLGLPALPDGDAEGAEGGEDGPGDPSVDEVEGEGAVDGWRGVGPAG